MEVNAKFDKVVACHTGALAWQASPMPGVSRRMLDRIGGEVARATSIVRYAPQSAFAEHTHGGGEEFIVLEGVFQDEHADYPAGSYVRNPIGTHHVPRSDEGCTIFVKLWQFDPEDHRQFALDLNAIALGKAGEGIGSATLHRHGAERVQLQQWDAETERGFADVTGGAEILILSGSLAFDGDEYAAHDWVRLPSGCEIPLRAGPDGARLWLKTGHLDKISLPPA